MDIFVGIGCLTFAICLFIIILRCPESDTVCTSDVLQMRPTIEEFIQNFKRGHDVGSLIETFIRGDCYHFAVILKNLYPEGRIVYDDRLGHFSLEYQEKYYDIRGEIDTPKSVLYFDEHCGDEELYKTLVRDCVCKIDYYPYGKKEI